LHLPQNEQAGFLLCFGTHFFPLLLGISSVLDCRQCSFSS